MRSILALVLCASLTSCASIVSKSSYAVTVDSEPAGAELVVRDGEGEALFEGAGPTTLTLDAGDGYFGKAVYSVEATFPGGAVRTLDLTGRLDGWYVGNILFGGLIGLLASLLGAA